MTTTIHLFRLSALHLNAHNNCNVSFLKLSYLSRTLFVNTAYLSPPKTTSTYGQEILSKFGIAFVDIAYLEASEGGGSNIPLAIADMRFVNEYHFNSFMYR